MQNKNNDKCKNNNMKQKPIEIYVKNLDRNIANI